ncbi:hypothetical protein KW782_03350 [Candidatus Parcubacteria bacterium]|nr:hypothetical protein [Candidatus Parcubacteria bacterium]
MEHFELKPDKQDFDSLMNEYLSSQKPLDRVKLISQMEGVASTVPELERVKRLVYDNESIKRRIQTRIEELTKEEQEEAA